MTNKKLTLYNQLTLSDWKCSRGQTVTTMGKLSYARKIQFWMMREKNLEVSNVVFNLNTTTFKYVVSTYFAHRGIIWEGEGATHTFAPV